MVSHGLNVPACRDISLALWQGTQGLTEIADDASYAVRRIQEAWDGPDAEEFLQRWRRQRSHVEAATEAIVAMRRRLDAAIEEQESTSRS